MPNILHLNKQLTCTMKFGLEDKQALFYCQTKENKDMYLYAFLTDASHTNSNINRFHVTISYLLQGERRYY